MRQIFRALPWIPVVEPPALTAIYLAHGRSVSFRAGELMKKAGDPNRIYFITRGTAAYYIADRRESHPNILNLLPEGRTACDLSALMGARVNVVTRTLTPLEALLVPPDVVTDAMKKDAALATLVARHVLLKEECSLEAMTANFTLEPEERLRTFLRVEILSLGGQVTPGWNELPLMLTHEQLGNIVNLTRVSVSRFCADWTARGLLRREGRRTFVKGELLDGLWDWLNGEMIP